MPSGTPQQGAFLGTESGDFKLITTNAMGHLLAGFIVAPAGTAYHPRVPFPDTFELFGFARYTPAGSRPFNLRAMTASDAYERRIIKRRRPYLDGAPLDDTGAEPDTFDIVALFAQSDTALSGRAGEAAYPGYHARFLREARKGGTGTLYFPGRGEKRVRLVRRVSTQTAEARNSEVVTLAFLEDLEDGRAGADTFSLPSAKTAPALLLRQFSASAVRIGLGGDLLDLLDDAVTLLEAATRDPFNAAGLIPLRAQRVLDLCGRVRRLSTRAVQPFEGNGDEVFAPLTPPDAAEALGLLALLEDAAAAQKAAVYGTATTRPRKFDRPLSIFDVAALLGQPVDDLIRLNARLPLFGIPPGVEIITRAA